MGLFDSKEEKTKLWLEKKGYPELRNLSDNDIAAMNNITNYMSLGNDVSLGVLKSNDMAQINFLQAISHQNLLIIKQLDQLNKNIEKLINK